MRQYDDAANYKDGNVRRLALTNLYAAADVCCDLRLRNATIDRLIASEGLLGTSPGTVAVSLACKDTPFDSTPRKLLIDYYLNFTNAEWLRKHAELFPEAFIVDWPAPE